MLRTFICVWLALILTSCATWKSPINQNSLIGDERVASDGEVIYHGTIDSSEDVSYFLQSGGRQIRLRFDMKVSRKDGKLTFSFTRADFGASMYYEFQDLLRNDYKAETRSNRSFDSSFIRQTIDEQTIIDRLQPFKLDSSSDERSLLEVVRLLFIYTNMENLNLSSYVGNQTLKTYKVTIFGHDFTLGTFSTVSNESQGLFGVDLESRLSASYFHKYEPKNSETDEADGIYYSLWGNDRVRSTYSIHTLLLENMDLLLNISGYQQGFFSDEGKLYMLWPTKIRIHVVIERAKQAS